MDEPYAYYRAADAQQDVALAAQAYGEYVQRLLVEERRSPMSGGTGRNAPLFLFLGESCRCDDNGCINLLPTEIQEDDRMASKKDTCTAKPAAPLAPDPFPLLFQNHPTPMWIYDLDSLAFLQVNDAAVEKYGYTRDEFLRMTLDEIRPPEDVPRLLADVKQKRPPLQHSGQWRHRLKDGRIIDVEITSYTLEFEGRQAALVMAQDVTERKRAEEQLRQSFQKYQDLVNSIDGIVWEADAKTFQFSFVSMRAERLSGYPVEQWLNEPEFWAEHIHPDDRAWAVKFCLKATAEGQRHELDYRMIAADGRIVWLRDIVNVIMENGEPAKLHGVMIDITERKLAEEALRQNENLFRESQRIAGLGSYLLHIPTGLWKSSNVLDKVFGIDETYERSVQGWVALVHPDDRERMVDYFTNQVLGKGQNFDNEYRIVRHNDHAERWVHGLGNLDFDAQGRAVNMHGTIQDVTARKQAEEKIAASEAELRALFASMQDMVLVIDREGIYRKIAPTNPSLLYKPPEELLGKNLRDVFPAEQAEGFIGVIHQTLEMRQTAHIEYILPIGERTVWFSTSISPMTQDSTLWVARDITERKLHERELEAEAMVAQALGETLERQPLLERLLAAAHHAVPVAEKGSILLIESDGRLRIRALHSYEDPRLQNFAFASDKGYSARAARERKPLLIADARADAAIRYDGEIEEARAIQSAIAAPLMIEDRAIGVITLDSTVQAAFREHDLQFLTSIASTAALVIENARLFEEARQRVAELETLNRISVQLRAVSKQDEMLAIVLEETLAALNATDGSVSLLNEATGKLHKTTALGWLTGSNESPVQPGEGILGEVFTSGVTVIAQDFSTDPRTRPEARDELPSGCGGICAPIRSPEQTLGVLLVAVPSERKVSRDQVRLVNTLAEMTGNALHRMRLHEETQRRLENLQALDAVDRAISSSFDLRPILNTVIGHAIAQLNVDAADVLLMRPALQTLQYAAGYGFHTRGIERSSVRLGEGHAGRAVLERRTTHVPNLPESGSKYARAAVLAAENFVDYYAVPLISKGEVKGVLEVFHHSPLHPKPEWVDFLETLAGQAAIAIDNSQLFENLQRTNLDLALAYDATIEGWSRALDLRDKETEGHTLRVTEMTIQLAKAVGISDTELVHIRRGALLHDIGKMGVPDSILLKPDKLTDDEWALMHRHPQLACDMLAPIQYLRPALDIPYCHHEKWDGTGYPRGLRGEEIPLAARLFAVADVYDALTSDRPYRKAWSKRKTLEHIRALAGTHFDPKVVELFLHITQEGTEEFLTLA
ncbi:MAG: PAS domain S-box protein [Chloroflexi bacterium]|nr:PAS domain S-box protein [Chloroflexota bacterium]